MTRDELFRIAVSLGCDECDGTVAGETVLRYDEQPVTDLLTRFAVLVADAEREACAQIVEAPHWKPAVRSALKQRAADIRARGAK